MARWNNHKLKEMRDEEETAQWRQRSGRLQRWREIVAEVSAEKQVGIAIPDGLQRLGLLLNKFEQGLSLMCLMYFFMVGACSRYDAL